MLSRERKARLCLMPSCKGKRFDLVHKFPMDNERAEQWKTILDMAELRDMTIDTIRKRFFICSKHFRQEDYKNCESRNLNKTAYPRLYLSNEENDSQIPAAQEVRLAAPHNIPPRIVPPESELRIEQSTTSQLFHNCNPKINLPSLPRAIRIMSVPKSLNIVKSPSNQNEVFQLSPSGGKLKAIRIDLGSVIPDKLNLTTNVPAVPANIKRQPRLMRPQQIAILDVPSEENSLTELPNTEAMELEQNDPPDAKVKNNLLATEIKLRERDLELHHPSSENPVAINYFWLRDHCQCARCYAEDTSQRTINILQISLDIKPVFGEITNDNLHIKWVDNHISNYNIPTLINLQSVNVVNRMKKMQSKFLWREKTIKSENYARVSLNDYLCQEEVAKSVVHSLLRFGVAFIENVPANSLSTELAIRRLFPVQKTLFGEMWGLEQAKVHSDSAYSNQPLSAHNDNTYFNDAAGLQVFHCIENAQSGGESLLVDGFRALKDLQTKHQEAYQQLCTVNVPSQYIEEGENHIYCAPIIRLDPITNEPEQIRFNLCDRAPMTTLPQSQMLEFYGALRDLTSEIQRPENEWWFKLTPGTVCIFDNWRVLHGRAMYTGRRRIVGCYVSRTHFMSAARNFNLIE